MTITQTGWIAIAAIVGLTLIGLTALTINSDGVFTLTGSKDTGTLIIEGKRALPTSEKTIDDCFSK
jgi:hypothetical protein